MGGFTEQAIRVRIDFDGCKLFSDYGSSGTLGYQGTISLLAMPY